jgi:hypothetical protein
MSVPSPNRFFRLSPDLIRFRNEGRHNFRVTSKVSRYDLSCLFGKGYQMVTFAEQGLQGFVGKVGHVLFPFLIHIYSPESVSMSNHVFVIKEGLTSYSLEIIGFFAAKNPMISRC